MKKRIAILAGGDSSEYVISVKSAEVVRKNIPADKYEATVIHMRNNDWKAQKDGKEFPIDKNDFSFTENGTKHTFDGVFFAIHGTPGEDGKLQGYFDILKLPYSTCGVHSAAVTFNKNSSKQLLKAFSINTAKSVIIFRTEDINTSIQRIEKEIGFPCFVKPNNGGSSYGASKVNKLDELAPALEKGFKEDNEVIVEEYIKGTEITCGVFNNKGKMMLFPITEIVTKNEFFDFDAKYNGLSEEITPARIGDKLTKECHEMCEKIYRLLQCKGVVRIDYLIRDEKLYFMEVNTIPGLSEASIIPQQAKVLGYNLPQLFDMILEDMFSKS